MSLFLTLQIDGLGIMGVGNHFYPSAQTHLRAYSCYNHIPYGNLTIRLCRQFQPHPIFTPEHETACAYPT